MKISSLELNNWGPFLANHEVDLSVSESAPVVIIHGENGRGKTSIMRSIFWCLYGVVRDSYGTVIPVEKIVNRNCTLESPSPRFSVKLVVEFESAVYEILREGTARQNPGGVSVENLELTVRLLGGPPLSESKATETINLMLEEAIADFYLFDGEKLSSVEKKLSKTDSESQQFVQKSVERALGLSFMDRLGADLDSIRTDFSDILTNHERLASETQKLVTKQRDLVDNLHKAQQDSAILADMRTGLESQVAEINRELQEFDQIREQAVKRQLLIGRAGDEEVRLSEQKKKLKQEAEQNWHWPLTHLISELELARNAEASDSEARVQRAHTLRSQIGLIERALEKHECSMCGSGVDHSTEVKLKAQLQSHNADLAAIESQGSAAQTTNLSILTNFPQRKARVPLLEELLYQIGKSEIALSGIRSDIAELNSQIGAGGTPDILKLEADKELCAVRINQAKTLLGKAGEAINLNKSQLHTVQQKLKDSPELNPVERTKLSLIDGLLEILRDSYEDFRESMRVQVEEAATGILQKLSTERDYRGVSISSKYQVTMLDANESAVPIPSSGYSQILALSFIGGLADVAGSSNSVVMDTPWGRVDRGNRKLIMNWIKSRTNQTIIFVQSGELTIPEAREEFGNRLGRQFSLERVSLDSSKIEGV